MIIAYDTETSGMPLYKERSHDPRQPHIVQAAWVKYDATGIEVGHFMAITRPDGWVSDPEALAIHGITHERAMDEGIPEADIVEHWLEAHTGTSLRVAHNPHFDDRILRIAMLRFGRDRAFVESVLGSKPKFDTCRATTNVVKPGPSEKMAAKGMKMSKSLSLAECLAHFFNEGADGAHDALWDARACGRLYWHLQSLDQTP